MKITLKNLKKLAENCNASPTEIGMAILKCLGYEIKKYNLSGAIYIYKNDKLVYYEEGAYVD